MRNWNAAFDKDLMKIVRLPDYLWGIETVIDSILLPVLASLPDYLWGIETFLLEFLLPLFYQASRLPMRNWNLASEVFRWLSCLHRFQTTYEELKRFRFFHQGAFQYRLPDYLWGIETTQEILLSQWNLASRLPMRNWNLRHFQNYRLQVRPASRLPMRNWNQK